MPAGATHACSAGAADFGDRPMPAGATHACGVGADAFGDRPMPACTTHACSAGAGDFAARMSTRRRTPGAASMAAARRGVDGGAGARSAVARRQPATLLEAPDQPHEHLLRVHAILEPGLPRLDGAHHR